MERRVYKIFFSILFVLALSWLAFGLANNPATENSGGEETPTASPVAEVNLTKKTLLDGEGIEPQKPLVTPPSEIKAIYLTADSAINTKKIDDLIPLLKKSGLNAMVIDIKDYSGYLSYDIKSEKGEVYQTRKQKIRAINSLIKKLHDENIYAIARVAVFQDPVTASLQPELAIKNRTSGKIWKDNQNLAWIDPASQEYWKYIVDISRDASERGFDEINFDYIRFPSDGRLSQMLFPFYDPASARKEETIKEFFVYLRSNLQGVRISADLFGLTTIALDDMGIGQLIEDAYQNFDYVSPMVYPSHYATGFMGYEYPARHPYEVVKHSIDSAAKKLDEYNKKGVSESPARPASDAKIRPWIQAFNMGGIYDAAKIKLQIKASDEAGGVGWMLWNPANNYSFLNYF